jgi:hypothetical protein
MQQAEELPSLLVREEADFAALGAAERNVSLLYGPPKQG